jgi:hypothetical protein
MFCRSKIGTTDGSIINYISVLYNVIRNNSFLYLDLIPDSSSPLI